MIKLAKGAEMPVLLICSYKNRETPSHLEKSANDVVVIDPEEVLKEIKITVDDRSMALSGGIPFVGEQFINALFKLKLPIHRQPYSLNH